MKAEFTKDENGTVRNVLSYTFRFGLYMHLILESDNARVRHIFNSRTIKLVRSINKIRKLYFCSLRLINKSKL